MKNKILLAALVASVTVASSSVSAATAATAVSDSGNSEVISVAGDPTDRCGHWWAPLCKLV